MKKIILTVTNDLNYDQRMQRICTTLADTGYEVLLIGRKGKNSLPLSKKNYGQHRLPSWFVKGKLFYTEYNIRLFLYLLFKKADCICAIDLDTILPCYYISRIKKTKRVYDAHEYFSQLDEVISRPAIYRFWHRIERKMVPRFTKGYTVCDSLAEEFKKNYGVSYSVIRNVPLLTDLNEQATLPGVILYQGAVNKGRGLEKVALAMKEIDARLWVCGDGNFIEEMKTTTEVNGLSGKIIFFGMVEPAILKKKTTEATVAINPFESTGLNQFLSLSNKFFDYIHAGIPQVTMNYPEYKKINEQYSVAVLIDDLKPATIAIAINKLLNDREQHSRLKQNCLHARQELSWQKEKHKLIEFYRDLFHE